MRYAVYFVPGDDTPLGRFGAGLFGRWPDGRAHPIEHDHPERAARTGRAARYGFHATLKAPFRLDERVDQSMLRTAVEALAQTLSPVPLAPLVVDEHGLATLALCVGQGAEEGTGAEPGGRRSEALSALAERCVRDLDRLRAPLDAAERARRRPERLSPQALERLERFGYPWVLDGFRFHMTLARGGEGAGDFRRWLERRVREAGAGAGTLDRLALCREAVPGAPLVRIGETVLGGGGTGRRGVTGARTR